MGERCEGEARGGERAYERGMAMELRARERREGEPGRRERRGAGERERRESRVRLR